MKFSLFSRNLPYWVLNLLMVPCFCLARCPEEHSLRPNCWCSSSVYGAALFCQNIMEPSELYAPVKATETFHMHSMTILNSTLRYLPGDLFVKSNFKKVGFYNTELMAFSDGELAFKGLEKHLLEIRVNKMQYASQWDFKQLGNLQVLQTIDINHVKVETIAGDLAALPKLSMFGLAHAGLTHISDNEFAACPKLRILSFTNNHVSVLKRSMLPNPALHLTHIDLGNNDLEILPDDFFTEMPALDTIELSNNKLTTLDGNVFSNILKRISFFNVLGNPLRCDCRLIWLAVIKSPTWLMGYCDAPAPMKGVSIKYLNPRHLRCD